MSDSFDRADRFDINFNDDASIRSLKNRQLCPKNPNFFQKRVCVKYVK